MKKMLMSLAAIVAIGFGANAQKKGDVSFGVKGGLNVSTIGADHRNNFDAKAGFHVGVLAEIAIDKKFAIQPEIVFSSQGAKGYYYDNRRYNGATLRLNYINVPVLVKYSITNQFSVEGGPQIGFNVSSKFKTDHRKYDANGITTADLALTAGVTYRLKNNVFFSARHNFGVTNIYKNSYGGTARNNTLQLSVGYKF